MATSVGRPSTAKETVPSCYPENKWRSDKGNEEEFHRRKKKAGFTMNGNLPSNTKYTTVGTGNTWQHDMFDLHEKGFEPGFGSNSNSTNGSFMQSSTGMAKGKQNYYPKKNSDSNRNRPPTHGSGFRQGRDRDHDYVDIQ